MLLKSPPKTAGHPAQQLEIWEGRGRSWIWGLPQHGGVDVTFMSGTALGAEDTKVNKRNTALDVKEITF